MFLIHIKAGCMIFLKRIILQINQNEEQAVFNRSKGTVPVDGKASPMIAKVTIHVIVGQILVMGRLEVRIQLVELFPRKTRQRTETLFVMLIICIFHAAKVRTRT